MKKHIGLIISLTIMAVLCISLMPIRTGIETCRDCGDERLRIRVWCVTTHGWSHGGRFSDGLADLSGGSCRVHTWVYRRTVFISGTRCVPWRSDPVQDCQRTLCGELLGDPIAREQAYRDLQFCFTYRDRLQWTKNWSPRWNVELDYLLTE